MAPRSLLLVPALLLLAATPSLAPAAAPDAPATVHDLVLGLLLERGQGVLPTFAEVDGGDGPRVVPFEESMAFLRANPGPLPLDAAEQVVAPTTDVGFATRTGPNPCHVAIIVYALSFAAQGSVLDVEPSTAAVPDRDIPCAGGTRSWVGDASARLAPDSLGWWAVLTMETPFSAAWLHEPTNTHVGDFEHVAVYGRVGYHQVRWCDAGGCLALGQLIAGTVNAPGRADAATISLA